MRVVDRGVNEIWRGRARDEGVAPPPPGDQERPKYKWRYIYKIRSPEERRARRRDLDARVTSRRSAPPPCVGRPTVLSVRGAPRERCARVQKWSRACRARAPASEMIRLSSVLRGYSVSRSSRDLRPEEPPWCVDRASRPRACPSPRKRFSPRARERHPWDRHGAFVVYSSRIPPGALDCAHPPPHWCFAPTLTHASLDTCCRRRRRRRSDRDRSTIRRSLVHTSEPKFVSRRVGR